MLYSVYILDSNLNDTNEFRSSLLYIAYICPLWFGFAHIHHFYHKITSGDTTIISAIITTLIQLTYTTIFGFIATLLFMRTGNIMGKYYVFVYIYLICIIILILILLLLIINNLLFICIGPIVSHIYCNIMGLPDIGINCFIISYIF